MSSMLEQAVVDAAALRESAIKSAEQVVIDQYSDQIKNAVEQLLEQEEPAPGDDADSILAKDLDSQLPESYHREIEDDQILEIDLHSLDLSDLTKEDIDLVGDPTETAAAVPPAATTETAELALEKCKSNCPADPGLGRTACLMACETAHPVTPAVPAAAASDQVELEESDLKELAETLKFDYENVADGGFANGQMKPAGLHDTSMVAEIAAMIDEYNDELEEKNEKLQKENKSLKGKLQKFNETKNKLINTANQIKEKFDEVQLNNAKLHYTNRALMDNSLNERQKQRIVEAINEVSTLEQAKIVYETLQGAVGASFLKKSKSLSEVVNKRNSSSILLNSRKDEKQEEGDDFAERMKRLAGIK